MDSFDARGNYVGSAFTNAPTFVSNVGAPPDADATYAGAWSIRIVNAGTSGHSRVDVDGFLAVTED